MSIRVGSIVDGIHPSYEGYRKIVVMTKSSAWGELGPYVLADENGRLMENIWQASKVYEQVPRSVQRYPRSTRVIWDHPAERHAEKIGEKWHLNKSYVKWRRKLENAPEPVRYPVGFNHRHKCLFALKERDDGSIDTHKLDYIESRKQIYLPVYSKLVKKQPKFAKLKSMLERGINLLIVEIDGPRQQSLEYYKEKYNVDDDFIIDHTILCTEDNLRIMLNDPKHPFGHGYCLAAELLGLTPRLLTSNGIQFEDLPIEIVEYIGLSTRSMIDMESLISTKKSYHNRYCRPNMIKSYRDAMRCSHKHGCHLIGNSYGLSCCWCQDTRSIDDIINETIYVDGKGYINIRDCSQFERDTKYQRVPNINESYCPVCKQLDFTQYLVEDGEVYNLYKEVVFPKLEEMYKALRMNVLSPKYGDPRMGVYISFRVWSPE